MSADISLTSTEEFELSVLKQKGFDHIQNFKSSFSYLFFLFSAALAFTLSFLLTRSCL